MLHDESILRGMPRTAVEAASASAGVRITLLPSPLFEQELRRLVLPEPVRRVLARLGELLLRVRDSALRDTPLNGLVVFSGPAGVGKSMGARACAQDQAKRYCNRRWTGTHFCEMRAANLFSDRLGQTAQNIAAAFEAIAAYAREGPTIVLLDEVESLGFSRALVGPSDPTDVTRATNELLCQLDRQRGSPHFLLIATTNIPERLDRALLDRADCVVTFPLPDEDAAVKILRIAAADARLLRISVDDRELAKAARALCRDGESVRPSGRLLSKLVLLAYLQSDSSSVSARDLVAAAHQAMAGSGGDPWKCTG